MLFRTWKFAVVLAVTVFIIIQSIMRWNQLYAIQPICKSLPYTGWTSHLNSLQSGIFLATLIIHLGTLVGSPGLDTSLQFDSTMTIGCVSFLACCASFMTLLFDWGGVCEDYFGYESMSTVSQLFISMLKLDSKSFFH